MNPFETLSSETAKLVYLYLREQGAATADELRASLDIPLLKLLPVLRTLESRSLVAHDGRRYVPTDEAAQPVPA
jgi:predicted transcriptional regulator